MFPTAPGFVPSPSWEDEIIFDAPANPHNPMMDAKGRVWLTSTVRRRDNPDWCKAGSMHPSAQYFPIDRSTHDVSAEEREEILEGLWAEGGFKFLWGGFSDLLIDPAANELASEFVRNKIRDEVIWQLGQQVVSEEDLHQEMKEILGQ